MEANGSKCDRMVDSMCSKMMPRWVSKVLWNGVCNGGLRERGAQKQPENTLMKALL